MVPDQFLNEAIKGILLQQDVINSMEPPCSVTLQCNVLTGL